MERENNRDFIRHKNNNILNNNAYNTTELTYSPLYSIDIEYEEGNYNCFANKYDIINNFLNDLNNDETRYFLNNNNQNKINEDNDIVRNTHYKNEQKPQAYINNNKTNNKKKLGRKRKNEECLENNKETHSKENPDNMRIKIKRLFLNWLIDWINYEIEKSPLLNKIGKKIVKLNSEIVGKKNSKDDILKMLNLSAEEYLSKDISKKNTSLKKDHNKKLIEIIYNLKEKKITDILDKSIGELMKIFCSNNTKFIKNIKINSLEDYINILKKENEDLSYISKFKDEAINFENKTKALKGRKRNKRF